MAFPVRQSCFLGFGSPALGSFKQTENKEEVKRKKEMRSCTENKLFQACEQTLWES